MMALVFCLVFLFSFSSVKAADYTLFARHPFDENFILPDTVPNTAEIQAAGKLILFSSRGELESATFAIYNSGASVLDNVEVSIPTLINSHNQSFSQDNIEINVVKIIEKRLSRWDKNSLVPRPSALIPYTQGWINDGEFDIPAKTSKQWWITVKANQNTQPGIYQGNIQIKPTNGPTKNISLEVEVSLAILLTNPEKSHGFWYHPPPEHIWNYRQGDLATIENFRKGLRADFTLMKKMGLQTVSGRSYTYGGDTSYLRVFLEEVKRAGLGDQPMFMMTLGKQSDPDWLLEAKSLSEEIGIPEFYWMTTDEAFQDRPNEQTETCIKRRKALRGGFNLIRQAIPDAKILSTTSFNRWYSKPYSHPPYTGWQEIEDEYGNFYSEYFQVHVYNGSIGNFGMTYRDPINMIEQHLQETGDIGYMYINKAYHVAMTTPYDHRIDSGLFLWILPVGGNSPWTYQSIQGDPYTDADGSETRGDVLYAYPDKYDNGNPIPALRFIGMREGIDDTRYFYTLEEAIRLSNNPSKKAEAQRLINTIRDTATSVIPCRSYGDTVQEVILPSDIDDWRKEIAQLIVELGQPSVPTVTPTPVLPSATPTSEPQCPNGPSGNLNCDSGGLINGTDLSVLLANWCPYPPAPTPKPNHHSSDLNNNNKVDGTDLSILLSNWKVE